MDDQELKKDYKTYFNRHFPFEELLGSSETKALTGKSKFNQFKVSKVKHYLVLALKVSPWICGLGVLFVFLMPFGLSLNGLEMGSPLTLLGMETSYSYLANFIQTVAVGGLIGFGTNWLAIRMLFRPLQKRPIWGQGMIPAQRDIIIDSLAQGINKHILSPDLIQRRIEESGLIKRLSDILVEGSSSLLVDQELRHEIKQFTYMQMKNYFDDEQVRKELREVVEEQLERKAEKGLKKLVLTTYKRFNREDYDGLINQVIADIPEGSLDVLTRLESELDKLAEYIIEKRRAPEVYMTRFITRLLRRLDIKGLLAKQMAHFDEARLERMVWEATNEQLLYIQYLGTVLGILGGLIIWDSRVALVYVGLVAVLSVLDTFLFRLKKPKASELVKGSDS